MDKTAFNEYVENRYNGQMDYYSKGSAKNQRKYKKFQWILIVLSATTPVLAALGGPSFGLTEKISFAGPALQGLLIIISAIVAILTTGLKTFDYQELWITYRSAYEKLKPEIHYYNFSVGPYGVAGVDKESLFVTRVEAILGAEHMQWPPAKMQQDNPVQLTEEAAPVTDPVSPEAGNNTTAETGSVVPSAVEITGDDKQEHP